MRWLAQRSRNMPPEDRVRDLHMLEAAEAVDAIIAPVQLGAGFSAEPEQTANGRRKGG